MFKPITVTKRRKQGRPLSRFVCPTCERGCRTAQGLKAHVTRMHSHGPHHEAPTAFARAPKGYMGKVDGGSVTDNLREVRIRICENINRLTIELGEIDKAIDVCERHLGVVGED